MRLSHNREQGSRHGDRYTILSLLCGEQTVATTDRISHLRGLLGPAVLLPWPTRSKGDRRKWKHLTLADMDGDHLAKVEQAGNIGVALGKVSGALVTIDLDNESYLDALLAENPMLRDTLRTRARRGCNIWVKVQWRIPSFSKAKKFIRG